jgi:hypothetical protein
MVTIKINMKNTISEEKLEELENEIIINYVKTKSPKIWHQMVMEWNWDNSSTFLNWLINNALTDKATALMIYWKSGPRYSKQFKNKEELEKSYYLNTFEFIEKLEHNYLTGFYKNQNFEYNPKNDNNFDWTNEYIGLDIVKEIPQSLFLKLEGEKINEPVDFTEGMPPKLYDKLEDLYDKYDI